MVESEAFFAVDAPLRGVALELRQVYRVQVGGRNHQAVRINVVFLAFVVVDFFAGGVIKHPGVARVAFSTSAEPLIFDAGVAVLNGVTRHNHVRDVGGVEVRFTLGALVIHHPR